MLLEKKYQRVYKDKTKPCKNRLIFARLNEKLAISCADETVPKNPKRFLDMPYNALWQNHQSKPS